MLTTSACRDVSDSEIARRSIGPDGGLITSIDSVLTIAIQPGALEQSFEFTIESSTDPPDIYGPAYRVQPSVELAIPATITYRFELPEDTSDLAIAYIDTDEYANNEGRWYPLPVVRLDPAQKLIAATETKINLYYGLLGSGSPPGISGGTSNPGTSSSDPTDPTDPINTDSATTNPTDSATTNPTDPTTDPGDSSTTEGESDTDPTTGNGPCDNLPAPPLAFDEFLFNDSPLDGGSEDMTFTTAGLIVTRNGDQLVGIAPDGSVTQIPTSIMLPAQTLGTRETPTGSIVTASQSTGEILEIQQDGTVTTLWNGLTLPNGIFVALDGTIFFTDFLQNLAAYIDGAGTMQVDLGVGGDEASQANGIVYDPDRNFVYYVAYGPGVVYRVDVANLANPGTPQPIATIGSEGGGDQVGLDGVAMDTCGNLYIVDQNQATPGGPGSLYRLNLNAAGDPVGGAELLVEAFGGPEPDDTADVANVVFAQGPGWEAFENYVFTIGLDGRIFRVDVGIDGAPTPAGG